MKSKADILDDLIRQAILPGEAAADERLTDPSVFELATEVFRGRNRWLAFLTVVVMTACMVFVVYCLVRMLGTNDPSRVIRWGVGFISGLLAVLGMKLWHWMEMSRLATSRELKRVQLQIAHLADVLKARPSE